MVALCVERQRGLGGVGVRDCCALQLVSRIRLAVFLLLAVVLLDLFLGAASELLGWRCGFWLWAQQVAAPAARLEQPGARP